MRFCPKCQIETERHKSGACKICKNARDAKYGRNHRAKRNLYESNWRIENPEKNAAYKAKYRAANKDKLNLSRAAYRAANKEKIKKSQTEYRILNRDKINSKNKEYRIANPEKAKASSAAWAAANIESCRIKTQNRNARKRANGGRLSRDIAQKLLVLQKNKCACCGIPLGDNYHLDHIVPIALGGSNTDYNIQLLHDKCNLQKGAKHPIDFMQARGLLL